MNIKFLLHGLFICPLLLSVNLEAQTRWCNAEPPYAIPQDPTLWCDPNWTGPKNHLVVTIPSEFHRSNLDGFGAWARHDFPLLLPEVRQWVEQGRYDPTNSSRQVRPDPRGPGGVENLRFATFNYNIFDPIDTLADKFCTWIDQRIQETQPLSWRLLIYTAGYGSLIHQRAIERCLPAITTAARLTITHLYMYPDTLDGFNPPDPDSPEGRKLLPFGPFDFYRHLRQDSPLRTALHSRYYGTLPNGTRVLNASIEGNAGHPLEYFSSNISPHLTDWFGNPPMYPELRDNYPFKYQDLQNVIVPLGEEYRYLMAVYGARTAVNTCYRFEANINNCPEFREEREAVCAMWRANSYEMWINCMEGGLRRGGSSGGMPSIDQSNSLYDLFSYMRSPAGAHMQSVLISTYRTGGFGKGPHAPRCGDGRVEGTEACDPPNGETCNGQCMKISCGDGRVEGKEECDPPNTEECDGSCKKKPKCGDGIVQAGEQCDPKAANSKDRCAAFPAPAGQELTGECTEDCLCKSRPRSEPQRANAASLGGI